MDIYLFSGSTNLGVVSSKIIDDSMGVVGGLLRPSYAYYNDFQLFFRAHTEKARWDELAQLDLKGVALSSEFLFCCGGICVTDVALFDEVPVEFCGLTQPVMDLFRQAEKTDSQRS